MKVRYVHSNCLNEVMNAKTSETTNIKIGMCGTEFVGSDRYAVVVTEVLGPKKIKVSNMLDEDYNSLNKNDEIQYLETSRMTKYLSLTEDGCHWQTEGTIYTYRKNGRWMPEGKGLWETCSIHLGYAEEYLDPSF